MAQARSKVREERQDEPSHWRIAATYWRTDRSTCVGSTAKCGSTVLRQRYQDDPDVVRDTLKANDHVTIYVRHPYDRLVSSWRWFTQHYDGRPRKHVDNPSDMSTITNSNTTLVKWARAAFKHKEIHWAPQTEIHPQWRRFHLKHISELEACFKKTERESWEYYWNDELERLASKYYAEDLIMWDAYKEGIEHEHNTGTD